MRLRVRLSHRLRKPPERHRLTIILSKHRGANEGQQFRLDIPVEVQHYPRGEILEVPYSARRNYLEETKEIDYVDVHVRSLSGKIE